MTQQDIQDFNNYVEGKYTTTISKRFGTVVKLFSAFLEDKGLDIKGVTEEDIKEFISSKEKMKMTEYVMVSALNCYGEYLGLDNIVCRDVESEKSAQVLSDEVIQKILSSHNTPFRDKLIIVLAYKYLFRRADIVHLQFSDIDIQKKTIKRGEKVLIMADEDIDLYIKYRQDLMEDIRRWQETRKRKYRPKLDVSNNVFQSARAPKLSNTLIVSLLNKYNTNVESLRDSGKILLLKQGYSVAEVLEMTGTDNYEAVTRLYKYVL